MSTVLGHFLTITIQVVAPNISNVAGPEDVSLGSDELTESLPAIELTTEQDQGYNELTFNSAYSESIQL